MGYKTEKLKSGALLVRDVPLMGPQRLGEKHFKVKDIDAEWMQQSLERFRQNKELGKLPYLWDRHNTKDSPAQVIGRLDNLRVGELDGEPWVFADVIISDPMHQEKFLSGKYPSKSVEYQPDNHYLRGLALLDGHEGHFDAGIPDFVPEGLYDELIALGADAECTVLCHSESPVAFGDIAMTKDELKALLAENNADLMKQVDEKLAAQKPTVSNKGDIDDAIEQVRESERSNAAAQIAKAQRNAKIEAFTAQLSAKTGTPETLIRRKLDSFQTDEGMDTYFRAAMQRAAEDVKLGIEREASGEADVADSYEEYKRNYPDTTVSLSEFKSLCDRATVSHEDRFAGRTVHKAQF